MSFQRIRDRRGPRTAPFPQVTIDLEGGEEIRFGTEQFSTANALDQDIIERTSDPRQAAEFWVYQRGTDVVPATRNWSPRIGFNYDLSPSLDVRQQVRGGLWLFHGRALQLHRRQPERRAAGRLELLAGTPVEPVRLLPVSRPGRSGLRWPPTTILTDGCDVTPGVGVDVPVGRNEVEFFLDVQNLVNAFSSASGLVEFAFFHNLQPVRSSVDPDTGRYVYSVNSPARPGFTGDRFTGDDLRSRWQAQLGLRYSFGR